MAALESVGGVLYGVRGLGSRTGQQRGGQRRGVIAWPPRLRPDGLEVFTDVSAGRRPGHGLVWVRNMLFGTTENGRRRRHGTLFQDWHQRQRLLRGA